MKWYKDEGIGWAQYKDNVEFYDSQIIIEYFNDYPSLFRLYIDGMDAMNISIQIIPKYYQL